MIVSVGKVSAGASPEDRVGAVVAVDVTMSTCRSTSGPVPVSGRANSEVLPSGSVAVAVTTIPAGAATPRLTSNVASPTLLVGTGAEPRKSRPWDGSSAAAAKNSTVNNVDGSP